VAEHEIVEIADLERGVIESCALRSLNQKKGVVVRWLGPAVAAEEGAERELRRDADLIRGEQTKAVFVPALRSSEVRDIKNGVS